MVFQRTVPQSRMHTQCCGHDIVLYYAKLIKGIFKIEYAKKLNMLAVKNLYFLEECTGVTAQCRGSWDRITAAIF